MKRVKNLSIGDVFAIKIENTDFYYFGRILFDVKEQYNPQINNDNYLSWHGESVLIETYKALSKEPEISNFEKIIDGVFIPKKKLLKENIIKIGNVPIEPNKVSFPETYRNIPEKGILFTVGELAIKTNLTIEYVDQTKVFPTLGNMYYIQLATLDYGGRKDLIEDKEDIMENYFKFSDLRSLPNVRKEVYEAMSENNTLSYYELALKHGFDLRRFY